MMNLDRWESFFVGHFSGFIIFTYGQGVLLNAMVHLVNNLPKHY
uniref:Uncharacterized protein n=1 Tax=Rhizophora mucronata TaxID=61149 RepID=A0A2P2PJW3_RHIMU